MATDSENKIIKKKKKKKTAQKKTKIFWTELSSLRQELTFVKTELSLGFSKQESQGHFLRKLGVPLCNFVKFSWKLGVPAQKLESGTADSESNENPVKTWMSTGILYAHWQI